MYYGMEKCTFLFSSYDFNEFGVDAAKKIRD